MFVHHNMSKLIFHFTIVCLLIFQSRLNAQEAAFDFDDELCRYKGIYDSTKFSSDQLRDTYKLVQGYYSIYSEDEKQLEDNYKNAKQEITNLKIVKSTYFQSLKDSTLNFLELTYQLKKVEFDAINGNRDGLMLHFQDNPTVKLYSEALAKGGKDLLNAYEHLTKEQMKNNASPDHVWNEYLRNIKSAQAQELAFKRVLIYGWWNSVNHLLPHINYDGTQFEEFKKIFSKVETVDCDEI